MTVKHKGFKFRTKGPVKNEEELVDFDDIDNVKQRKRDSAVLGSKAEKKPSNDDEMTDEQSVDTDEDMKQRGKRLKKTVAEKGSKEKKGQEGKRDKQKLYYPDVKYDCEKLSRKGSHKDIFVSLINDVCKVEEHNLVAYFKSIEDHTDNKNKILSSLLEVLNKVKDVAQECPDDIVFAPEIPMKESKLKNKKELDDLLTTLAILQEKSLLLASYESDIERFATDYDIWIDRPSMEGIENKSNEINIDNKNANNFNKLLQNLNNQCQKIIEDTNSITHIMTDSRQRQNKLYDAYQKVRIPVASTSKEIIKVLSKF